MALAGLYLSLRDAGRSRWDKCRGGDVEVKLNVIGMVLLQKQQGDWKGRGSIKTALFVGREMMVAPNPKWQFELHYLGFCSGEYDSLESAQAAAPDFARAVLLRMTELV